MVSLDSSYRRFQTPKTFVGAGLARDEAIGPGTNSGNAIASKLCSYRISYTPKTTVGAGLARDEAIGPGTNSRDAITSKLCAYRSGLRRLLTSAGTSSPAMRLRNNAARASSNVVTGTVIASRIGISHACSTGPDLSAEK